MLLFIDADAEARTGWLGYDCVVNRTGRSVERTSLERNVDGNDTWQKGATCQWRAKGNELELAVPRSALGIERLPHTLDFKWADGIEPPGDASDFTLNGDAAPNDRFNYRARLLAR